MSILDIWRESQGAVLRREYEDVIARMSDANPSAKAAFLNNIHQTIDQVIGRYSSGSKSERKLFLEGMRKSALEMWNSGDWPSSLGLAIASLNAQSRFVPGDDAAYIRLETDRLIKDAATSALRANS